MVHRLVANNRRLRSILSLVVAFLLIGLTSYIGVQTYRSSQAATERSIYLTPAGASLKPGDTLSVTVRANSGSTPVNSVQASLVFDTARLQYVNMTEGTAFPTVAATSTNEPGVIRVGRGATDAPVTGDNAVVTINFKVLSTGGTAAVSLERAYSMLVTSADSQDILQQVEGASFTVVGAAAPVPPTTPTPPASPTPPPPAANPSGRPLLYLNPASGSYKNGDNIAVAVRVNAGGAGLTTVQSVLRYPADSLQYVSTSDEGSAFATKQRTTAKDGAVDIIRGIAGGGTAVSGDQLVATVNFKVISSSGTAALSFANGTSAYDASGTGQNVLDVAASRAASFTIGSTAASNGSKPSAGTTNGTLTTSSQTMTVKTTGSGRAAVTTAADGSLMTELSGNVELAPIIDQSLFASNPNEAISKVEYYLNGRLMSAQTEAPYAYKLSTNDMRNGIYTLDIRTFYASGRVDSRTETLQVNNEIDAAYVARHYLLRALTTFVILIVLALAIWKFVIPRFPRGSSTGSDDGMHGNGHQTVFGPVNGGPIAGDPVVVAPVGAGAGASASGVSSLFSGAAAVFGGSSASNVAAGPAPEALPMTPVSVTPLVSGSAAPLAPAQDQQTVAPTLITPSPSSSSPAAPTAAAPTQSMTTPTATVSPAASPTITPAPAAAAPSPTSVLPQTQATQTPATPAPASQPTPAVQPKLSPAPQPKYSDPSFLRPRRSFIGESPVKQPAFASAPSDLSPEQTPDSTDPYRPAGDRRGY